MITIESQFSRTESYCLGCNLDHYKLGWEGGVFVIMHGGSRRIGPSNEAVTRTGGEKMDEVD